MPKLTKRLVDAVEASPDGKDQFVWDSDVKGFGLKITPTGSKSYVLQYRTGQGKTRRHKIGLHGSPWTPDEARSRAALLLRGMADGIDPQEVRRDTKAAVTVEQLALAYLAKGPAANPEKKASSWATDATCVRRHIIPLLGSKIASSLDSQNVSDFQADVSAGKSACDVRTGPRGRAIVKGGKTIARLSTSVLSCMYNFGMKKESGLGLKTNPVVGVKLNKINRKTNFLDPSDALILFDAISIMVEEGSLSASMADAIRLLLLTGCRKNEILKSEWSCVDFYHCNLNLDDSKTGKKSVPLSQPAIALLKSLPRTSIYMFPSSKIDGPIVGLQKAWERVRRRAFNIAKDRAKAAGLSEIHAKDFTRTRLHDLRHSFASFAVSEGVPLLILGRILGHKHARSTEIYAHLQKDPVRAATDLAGASISKAVGL